MLKINVLCEQKIISCIHKLQEVVVFQNEVFTYNIAIIICKYAKLKCFYFKTLSIEYKLGSKKEQRKGALCTIWTELGEDLSRKSVFWLF